MKNTLMNLEEQRKIIKGKRIKALTLSNDGEITFEDLKSYSEVLSLRDAEMILKILINQNLAYYLLYTNSFIIDMNDEKNSIEFCHIFIEVKTGERILIHSSYNIKNFNDYKITCTDPKIEENVFNNKEYKINHLEKQENQITRLIKNMTIINRNLFYYTEFRLQDYDKNIIVRSTNVSSSTFDSVIIVGTKNDDLLVMDKRIIINIGVNNDNPMNDPVLEDMRINIKRFINIYRN